MARAIEEGPSGVEEGPIPAIPKPPPPAAGLTVETPLGGSLTLSSPADVTVYEQRRDAYRRDFEFENASDLGGLETLLSLEVSLAQIQRCIAQGRMDNGQVLRPTDTARFLTQSNALIQRVEAQKRSLGMDRESRARATADNPGTYLSTLLIRAKQYGASRNEEVIKAVDLWHALKGIVERYDRSNDFERMQVGITSEADIVDWIRDKFPEFDAIDARFRSGQKDWVGSL